MSYRRKFFSASKHFTVNVDYVHLSCVCVLVLLHVCVCVCVVARMYVQRSKDNLRELFSLSTMRYAF